MSKQGIKYDEGKPDWSLLPLGPVEDIVRVLTHGAEKYGRANWQNVEGAHERYFAAAMRHIAAWQSTGNTDPESGHHHLAHAACNLIFLMWFDDAKRV